MSEIGLKFIFRAEITEAVMPVKLNWLCSTEDKYDKDIVYSEKELYFSNFEEMSKEIDAITAGFRQYWFDLDSDINQNNIEYLEYHNGCGVWDKEINIKTSRIYLTESFWRALVPHINEK